MNSINVVNERWLACRLCACLLALCATGATAVESAFTYQGELTDSGVEIDGSVDMNFSLFDAETAGTLLDEAAIPNVIVDAGRFTVDLPLDRVHFDGSARWLEIAIAVPAGSGNFEILAPRQRIRPAPYALFADSGGLDIDPDSFWSLTGNAAAPGDFIGTTNGQPIELRVDGLRVLEVSNLVNGANFHQPNWLAGSENNIIAAGAAGATIGGGGGDPGNTSCGPSLDQPCVQTAAADYATIGGGRGNHSAGAAATVAGGNNNTADGTVSAISGGSGNRAGALWATVGGGGENLATNEAATVSGGSLNNAEGAQTSIAGGFQNHAGGLAATVGGGGSNRSDANYSTISGGFGNRTTGTGFGTIGGGASNSASDDYATIAGGQSNQARGPHSSIGGGESNEAEGPWSTVGGGIINQATGSDSTVGGGRGNDASNAYTTVGGGTANAATGENATVGGGFGNSAAGDSVTIAGGRSNQTGAAAYASILGGIRNSALGSYSAVGGGEQSTAFGDHSVVPGGKFNRAGGHHSFAAGLRAKVRSGSETGDADGDEGTFVWADATDADFPSTGANQFLVRAGGGAAIGVNDPEGYQLRVLGPAWIDHSSDGEIDLVVGGTTDTGAGDDGRIASNPNLPTSDLSLISNDNLHFVLDADNAGEPARMELTDGAGQTQFEVDRDGNALFRGDLNVGGTLSKGGGSFKIDHPLAPTEKYLYHSFVESPDMMNVYNGNVVLDATGEAWVEMPEWFEALNRDFRYQLTSIGGPGPNLHVADAIADNRFRIAGGTPGLKVSWQVTGIRQDPYAEANRIPVEVDKPEAERGTLLHPSAWRGDAGRR
jgi:hypothetical protein